MFFQELFPVARHTPMSIIVTPNGTQLTVIVTPKPSGDAEDNPALASPIKMVGTPADLDKEFADALRTYAGKVNELRTAIDLPTEALDAETVKAAKGKSRDKGSKRSAAAKRTPEKRAAKAERDQAAAAKRTASAKKAAATRAAKDSRIKPPGAGAETKKAVTPRSSLPGKPECLADLKELFPKLGADLTRRSFIKKAKTGRRYEKLWTNWEAFIDEGMPATKEACIAELKTAYTKHVHKLTEKLFMKDATIVGQRFGKLWKTWDAFFAEGVPEKDRIKWTVRTVEGKDIATVNEAPKAGRKLTLEDGDWYVIAVDGFNVIARPF